jgi:hypothetical protein
MINQHSDNPQPTDISLKLNRIILKIPLLRIFGASKGHDYKEAGVEFWIVWLFSVIPIGMSVFIDFITKSSVLSGRLQTDEIGFRGIWDRVALNLDSGEIFIYIISFLGTVAFVVYKHGKNGNKIEDFGVMLLLGGSLGLVAAIIFGLQRSGKIVRTDLVNTSATLMYALTLILFMAALLLEQRRLREGYAGSLRSQEKGLTDELKGYRPH